MKFIFAGGYEIMVKKIITDTLLNFALFLVSPREFASSSHQEFFFFNWEISHRSRIFSFVEYFFSISLGKQLRPYSWPC